MSNFYEAYRDVCDDLWDDLMNQVDRGEMSLNDAEFLYDMQSDYILESMYFASEGF